MFENQYSVKGLRKRATRLKECPYKLILELAADQLENKKIDRAIAKKAIEYIRTNNNELIGVAIKMLNPSQEQVNKALSRLRKM